MAFKDVRRQKFLSENRYSLNERRLLESMRRSRNRLVTDNELIPAAKASFRWAIASDGLEQLMLHYTAGCPIEDLRDQLPQVIADFDIYIANETSPRKQNPPQNVADTLEITQLEAYVYVFWLLALCKLLRHDEFIPKVMGWVDRTFKFNRGRDGLFENVVHALTGRHVPAERVLLHPLPYRPLARATVYAPEERPALVKEFVETWYRHMKPCYWYGTHTDGYTSYFGYWAFEAALVTVLWDIDDSSYRDHLVYPKDLVDWYRSHRNTDANGKPPEARVLRAMPGEPCPRAGSWMSPLLSKTVKMKAGEPMPGPELTEQGMVIWYLRDERNE
jgi:hypothetical protein